MSTEEKGPDNILDQITSEIRNEPVDPAQVRKAAGRAWARIEQETAGATAAPETIRTCEDFQALIPAWRGKRLTPARAMLLEDHLHECPACRKAAAGEKVVAITGVRPGVKPMWRMAAAAAVVAAVGLTGWLASDLAVPGGTGPRATVYAMDGPLYRIANHGVFALAKNDGISEAERVRSSQDGGAVLRLRDGSLVEMAARTELSISQRRSGVTIHLDRGAVIVQAAKQHNGRLYVATDDCNVSVKGTIFEVNHGVKGSRVSVVEGEVNVEHGDELDVLRPGDQVVTSESVSPVSLEEEFSWSRDFDKYLALMKDFGEIRKKVEALPGRQLRYDSKLLDLLPVNTQFYAAIPNIGETIHETNRIFREQMAQSPVMQQWWAERVKNDDPAGDARLNEMFERLRVFSSYLGPEVVVALAPGAAGAGKHENPLILAEVATGGFREYLTAEVAKLNAEARHGMLRIVEDPFQAAPAGEKEMLIYTGNGIVAASPDMQLLQAVARPAAGAFRGTAFGRRIEAAYNGGAGWLFCIDTQSMMKPGEDRSKLDASGFDALRYIVVQRKEVSGKSENRAELDFAGVRRGVASWLAEPAPIRGLDYVSQDAAFAAGFAVKEPALAAEDIIRMAGQSNSLAEFEAKTGLSVRGDLMAPFGGEIVFAMDGPMLPVPSWKLVIGVHDPQRVVSTIETLVAAVNRDHPDAQVGFTTETAGGRTFWTISNPKKLFEAHFTFDSGFMIAAPTRDLIERAMQYQAAGYSLPKSQAFQTLLPRDGHTNFSGMTYYAVGSMLKPFAQGTLTPEQQKALAAVAGDTPALILFYGEQDRIEIASRGTFFGLRPEQLMGLPAFGIQHHKGGTQKWSKPKS